jgi:hypothetical protein
MEVKRALCLFEQSGTFKNEFIKLGIPAEDYDILNDFGETDHVCDLFEQIAVAYDGKPSLFDRIGPDDIVLAFFPCTRFESQVQMYFSGNHFSAKKWSDLQKLEYVLKLHEELHFLYSMLCKLFIISIRGGWRLVVENPVTQPHYLTTYFPIRPAIIDWDRTKNGDYYKKPTQYWFVNCKPEQNMFFEPIEEHEVWSIERAASDDMVNRKVRRSLMHSQYARRFIRMFITEGGENAANDA